MENLPKYMRIAIDLRGAILDGHYDKTQQLPVEKALCEQYNVSKITIKKAVDVLAQEGLVIKKQGSGTYINSVAKKTPLHSKYTSQMLGFARNHPGIDSETKVMGFEIIKANQELADALYIHKDDFVYELERVRVIDGIPQIYEHTFMPLDAVPGLNNEIVHGSVYSYIIDVLKKRIDSSHEYIYAEAANQKDHEYLEIPVGDPIAVLEQIVFLDTGMPFQYSVTHYRYKHFRYKSMTKFE
ncbi:GntR family transcriptional regulator [Culicoidibacter larvae]|uniref:GntR family transcriptional regulator n=1 Tax=Culicoidibacter larvae TaxID=2579976 RepID=A0A5R8QA50_9FIRM|nr:GntR family transcriptional regulator [Culicoidibacter larvae]TLG72737.1 GntR family transcriptional regulator [Culicoidibacter larvae]